MSGLPYDGSGSVPPHKDSLVDKEDEGPLGTLPSLSMAKFIPSSEESPTAVTPMEDMTFTPDGLTDQTNLLPTRQVVTIMLGLSVAMICSFIDQTIIATALPQISSQLHSGRDSSWVTTAYLLTSFAFTPLYGRWSDIFGRKIILLVSLCIFWIFSLACALAQTMTQLILFRALQGVGGGAIVNMVLIIVSDIVALKDRGKYQGIQEIIVAISNGVGPILGGLFSQYSTWRWCFWINLPLAGLAMAIVVWLIPLKTVHGDMKFKLLKIDYVGSLLTILWSVLLLLGLTWGGAFYPWASARVLVPLCLGVALIGVFVYWEAKWAKLPIVPIHIFKNRTVVGVYIVTLMFGLTFFANLYYVPQFLQLIRNDSPTMSSVLILPCLVTIPPVVLTSVTITARTGSYKPTIAIGFTLWAIGQGLLSTINQHSSVGKIVGILLMIGVASGCIFQTTLIAVQAAVERHEVAVVTGVRNLFRLFGSTLALAICATIVNNYLVSSLGPLGLSADQLSTILNDPTSINRGEIFITPDQKAAILAGYQKGFRSVFYLTVACMGVGLLSTLTLIQSHQLVRGDEEKLKQVAKERLAQQKLAKKNEKDISNDIEANVPHLSEKA